MDMSIIRVLPSFPGGKLKAFTMSYDDGVRQDERLISLMEKYGLKGTFNLNSGYFYGGLGENEMPQTDKEEILKRYDRDFIEVSTHTVTHPLPSELSEALFIKELIKDRSRIEELFGRIVTGHAYPSGQIRQDAPELLKKLGFSYARGVKVTHSFALPDNIYSWCGTCRNIDEKLFELCDEFLSGAPNSTEDPWLFYLWGHSYEFDGPDNWERIEKFLKKIGGHDDVWYATNGEVADYLRDFGRLEFSADGRSVYNPTASDICVRVTTRENGHFCDLSFCVPSGSTTGLDYSKAVII